MNTLGRQIIISIACLAMGIISLTNFVFATGETAPSASVECPACSSGSPDMKAYITWMSEILTIIWWASNLDPGAIPWQQTNITRKNQETSAWATYTSDNGAQSISQQARGVKSDLTSLNKLHDSIALAGITAINKAQRDQQVDTTILTSIKSKVWTSKLLAWVWSRPTTMKYQDLLSSLVQLHAQVWSLTLGTSGSTIARQWYIGNTGSIAKLTTYYSCAQTIPVCSNQLSALNDMSASVRWYWGDILRAGQQISEVFSAQYRDTGPWSKKIAFGDGFGQAWDKLAQLWSSIKQITNSRKKQPQAIVDKNEAIVQQKEQQQKQTETIQQTQEAIKQWWTTTVASTQTQVQWVVDQPSYNTQDISYLAQMLNAANDELLSERIEVEKYTLITDSRVITYEIPKLTKQIYDTQQSLKKSASTIYNQCLKHCTDEVKKQGDQICWFPSSV